ncbi:MAG: hypothetical protein ACC653_10985 [Gammaproteobacteria bacterium]
METKIEAEPEKETVADNQSTDTTESQNNSVTQSKKSAESSLQRLMPAIIVSVSIVFSSGILSATSFAKSKDMAPQVRNFYYQMPPPGPYRSNLAMPQQPMAMNRPNWAKPTPPPWVQNAPGQQAKTANDHNTTMAHPPRMMKPPAWVNQPPQMMAPQMNRPNWARPTPPPWVQNAPGQQSNRSSDQKAMMARPPQMMAPPAWAKPAPQMNRPNWARPTPPPWVQPAPGQQPNLSADQKAMMARQQQMMAPPAWAQQPPQMNRPNWARPTPPWMQNRTQELPKQQPSEQK